MKEERYAYRIRHALNHGLKEIPPASSRRLEAARHLALSRQKQVAGEVAWAGVGNINLGHNHHFPYFRQLLAMLALLLGMWISFYWHSVQYVSALEEVDSALLSDDLPPEAFLDNDFFEWLIDDSPEE
ncbi:DUF3619 family protein [Azonexus sp. IMCC34839]|uniref:DUF3619 family protein n=1 Tax=Azonexus sp. IMCC34839 TaxID=3133695 RepID=UPI00399ADDC6